MCAQLQQDDLWVRWVDQAFSKLDLNGDGYISLEEIMHHLPLVTTDPDDDIDSERLLEVPTQLPCNCPAFAVHLPCICPNLL